MTASPTAHIPPSHADSAQSCELCSRFPSPPAHPPLAALHPSRYPNVCDISRTRPALPRHAGSRHFRRCSGGRGAPLAPPPMCPGHPPPRSCSYAPLAAAAVTHYCPPPGVPEHEPRPYWLRCCSTPLEPCSTPRAGTFGIPPPTVLPIVAPFLSTGIGLAALFRKPGCASLPAWKLMPPCAAPIISCA
eukprot:scaffold12410_cov119-Isochrysis_galbana.AAC.2